MAYSLKNPASKSGFVTIAGQKFEVKFSQYSDEYFECHTKAQLNEAAKQEILARLNELVEIQNENALATLHHA